MENSHEEQYSWNEGAHLFPRVIGLIVRGDAPSTVPSSARCPHKGKDKFPYTTNYIWNHSHLELRALTPLTITSTSVLLGR